jgi:SPP1 family predicted phage head-tail adaptor
MFKEVLDLLTIKKESDGAGGFDAVIDNQRTVFAEKKSVRGSEFYQAAQADLRVESIFKISLFDYQDERYILHNDKYYSVVRTFETGDFVELSCERRTGSLNEVV